jgi:hypothetical protein
MDEVVRDNGGDILPVGNGIINLLPDWYGSPPRGSNYASGKLTSFRLQKNQYFYNETDGKQERVFTYKTGNFVKYNDDEVTTDSVSLDTILPVFIDADIVLIIIHYPLQIYEDEVGEGLMFYQEIMRIIRRAQTLDSWGSNSEGDIHGGPTFEELNRIRRNSRNVFEYIVRPHSHDCDPCHYRFYKGVATVFFYINRKSYLFPSWQPPSPTVQFHERIPEPSKYFCETDPEADSNTSFGNWIRFFHGDLR